MKRWMAMLLILPVLCSSAIAEQAKLPADYLAACRVAGETTDGVTFAVTQATYDGAVLTIEVLLTPNDGNTALMDNQVEVPPDDSWFLKEKEEAAALGDMVLGVLCDLYSLTDEKGNKLADEYRCTPVRKGRTMTYTFEVPIANAPEVAHVELAFGVNEDLGFHFERDVRLIFRVPLFVLVPLGE